MSYIILCNIDFSYFIFMFFNFNLAQHMMKITIMGPVNCWVRVEHPPQPNMFGNWFNPVGLEAMVLLVKGPFELQSVYMLDKLNPRVDDLP